MAVGKRFHFNTTPNPSPFLRFPFPIDLLPFSLIDIGS